MNSASKAIILATLLSSLSCYSMWELVVLAKEKKSASTSLKERASKSSKKSVNKGVSRSVSKTTKESVRIYDEPWEIDG